MAGFRGSSDGERISRQSNLRDAISAVEMMLQVEAADKRPKTREELLELICATAVTFNLLIKNRLEKHQFADESGLYPDEAGGAASPEGAKGKDARPASGDRKTAAGAGSAASPASAGASAGAPASAPASGDGAKAAGGSEAKGAPAGGNGGTAPASSSAGTQGGGGGEGKRTSTRGPSARQIEYIRNLATKKGIRPDDIVPGIGTAAQASKVIEDLLSRPDKGGEAAAGGR